MFVRAGAERPHLHHKNPRSPMGSGGQGGEGQHQASARNGKLLLPGCVTTS